ncbi:MAG: sugar transferase [Acidimicrobiia bacterium]
MALIEDVQPSHRAVEDGVAGEADGGGRSRTDLRRKLVMVDVTAVALAWLVALAAGTPSAASLTHVVVGYLAVTAATMAAVYKERLYQSRVAEVRSGELARLSRVGVLSGVAGYVASRFLELGLEIPVLAGGALLTFALLAWGRGRYQAWIRRERSNGNFGRRVVVVGGSDEAAALVELFHESPELGLVPVGFAGAIDVDGEAPAVPYLGRTEDVVVAVEHAGASGVVIATSSISSRDLNRLVRDLHANGVHVHLSSGISGVHHKRLRVQPVGYEPFIYVEPASLSKAQLAAKRTLDVVGALVGLVASAPLLAVVALAIKLDDRGPVLFRQERVGRDGRTFRIFKLRTMCVDAEARLAELTALNERNGPLFKVTDDPRVTRVGRFLRSSSIDELPQLLNVLAGSMSLVGPRPALVTEVASFDGRLVDRHLVKPGMTGLWQVEARDKASFEAYRRLDLFYVENWSVSLDLAVLLRTGGAVWHKARGAVGRVEAPVIVRRSDCPSRGDRSLAPVPAAELAE